MPLALVILFGLFMAQSVRDGARRHLFSARSASLWFLVLAAGGIHQIWSNPTILVALNPWHGVRFILQHGMIAVPVLGLVFLAVTGGRSALRRPRPFWSQTNSIRLDLADLASFDLELFRPRRAHPCNARSDRESFLLALSQRASDPDGVVGDLRHGYCEPSCNYRRILAFPAKPSSSASFHAWRSVTPPKTMSGQIYLPRINWMIFACVILVTVMFGTSSKLAAAYGVAVTANMILDVGNDVFSSSGNSGNGHCGRPQF